MPHRTPPHAAAWRDLAWVVAVTVVVFVFSTAFELGEHLYRWTRDTERFQLDEMPVVLCVLAIGLAWFAWRRYRDAERELAWRHALEQQAESLLAENRRLGAQAREAQEQERRHLARELHDELGQYLNAISLDAARIRDLAASREPEIHRVSLGLVQSAGHVYRQIGGMIRRLRPLGLDEFGLPAALEHCVEGWRERLPNASFSLAIEGDFTGLTDALNITLYRLVQEGLTNVSKFARAAHVEIFVVRGPRKAHGQAPATAGEGGAHAAPDGHERERLGLGTDEIVVTLADDGPGVDLGEPRNGLGLIGMRERVEALGGEFHIASRPGKGFLLCARIPAEDT
jgi:two-component system, NarL family, sensor histidine kinase UhpB